MKSKTMIAIGICGLLVGVATFIASTLYSIHKSDKDFIRYLENY